LKKEGGLHIKGQFYKKSKPERPLISIITVVRNGEKDIEQTIWSVLNQTYDNIEYIIVDGASTDGTLGIIKKYENKIIYWISEPDEGKYDAMNKGSNIASGDYALYLCAGDYLRCNTSIEDILREGLIEKTYPLLVVGKAQFSFNNELLNWYWPICEKAVYKYNPQHQAILISKSIYKKIFYKPFFEVGADSMFWEELRHQNLLKFKYVDVVISVFRLGGVSSGKNMKYSRLINEQISVYKYSKEFNLFRTYRRIAIGTIKKFLLSAFGERIYYKYILYGVYLLRKRIYNFKAV
jgi:glycosyltransferase involved in cell wall biosynthesis